MANVPTTTPRFARGFRKAGKKRPLTRAERLALAPSPPRAAQTRYLILVEWLDRRVRAAIMRRLGDAFAARESGYKESIPYKNTLRQDGTVPVRGYGTPGTFPCGVPLPDWAQDRPGNDGWRPRRALREDASARPPGRYSEALDDLQGDIDALMLEFEPQLIKVANEVARGNVNAAPDLGGSPGRHQASAAGFVRRNVRLIKGLQSDQIDRLEAIVNGAGAIGGRVEPLAQTLEREFNLTKARASLIARDQTLKLNAQITQERQQAAGVETYIWTTAGDSRVRGKPGGLYPNSASNHWKLDGTRQSWAKPPITNEETGARNHPGEDFQCRCVALPDVDAILRGGPAPEPTAYPVDTKDAQVRLERAGEEYELRNIPISEVNVPPVWQAAKLPPILEGLSKGKPLPAIRAERGADGRWEISDGIHRANASKSRGLTHIPAIVPKERPSPPPAPAASAEPRYRLEAQSGGGWYQVGGLFKSPAGAQRSYSEEAKASHERVTAYRIVAVVKQGKGWGEPIPVADLPSVHPRR